LNEKIALLTQVGIIKPDGTEAEINTEIVNYFATADPDSHDFLLKGDASEEDIIEAAIGFIQKNADSGSGAENIRLSSDAYGSATSLNATNPETSVTNPGTSITTVTGTGKNTSNVKDITTQLAGSLPSSAKSQITNMLDVSWGEIMTRANGTVVAAYCVDTPVREHLEGKTFSIISDEYKKAFSEKYLLSNVFDDSEYTTPEGGERQLVKEGPNITKYKEILGKIQSGAPFNVRVPEVHNQKVIGVLLKQNNGTSQDEKALATKDVPIYVLTDCGGKIPGQPGIIVTGISSRTSQRSKNGTVDIQEKQSFTVRHKGKAVAIKSDSTKYLRVTSESIHEEAAKKEFGSATRDYSVSSDDSFIYLDKDQKKHTVRVRGKIPVPYFKRKDEFVAAFGPIAAANRVEALTDADKKNVAVLFNAAANSDYLKHDFAAAIGLPTLVANIEKNNQTPAFNAATANVA